MSQITIGSTQYNVYATVEEADAYLAASIGSTWSSATTLTKQQALVTATRIFDRTCWKGEPTAESGQPLAWPRQNVVINGETIDENTIPADIFFGSIELASQLVAGSTVETNPTPGKQGIETLKAGSVLITYFRDAEALALQQNRFPLPVQELVGRYMCSSGVTLTGVSTGTSSDQESVTADDLGYNEGV